MKAYFLWLAKFVTVLFVLIFFVPLVVATLGLAAGMVSEKAITTGKNRVAVVEVSGIINSAKDTVNELHRQIKNKDVKGVVVRVESPGGAVAPAQEIFETIKLLKKKKPVVVSMGAVAASGGLYLSLGASKIFCQPGTITGSIGVIMQVPNVQELAERAGVTMTTIKSGDMKDAGNMFRPMADEERAYLEKTADEVHREFIRAVADARGLPIDQVVRFSDGRIILGSEAKAYNLVDGYGGVYEAARAVFDLLGEPLTEDEEPDIYYPAGKFENLRRFVEAKLAFSTLMGSPMIRLAYLMPQTI